MNFLIQVWHGEHTHIIHKDYVAYARLGNMLRTQCDKMIMVSQYGGGHIFRSQDDPTCSICKGRMLDG